MFTDIIVFLAAIQVVELTHASSVFNKWYTFACYSLKYCFKMNILFFRLSAEILIPLYVFTDVEFYICFININCERDNSIPFIIVFYCLTISFNCYYRKISLLCVLHFLIILTFILCHVYSNCFFNFRIFSILGHLCPCFLP